MKFSANVVVNLKIDEVKRKVDSAVEKAIKDTVLEIENSAKKGSPIDTGHNRRSITSEAEGKTGKVYSTSGYGGWLEVGTRRMPARPYFKPALDEHFTAEKFGAKVKENLG